MRKQVEGKSTESVLNERQMDKERKSLRLLIENWFAPTSATPVRLRRLGTPFGRKRCVCIEVTCRARSVAILFFRHGDGTWHVFPPEAERLAMRGFLHARRDRYKFGETEHQGEDTSEQS